MRAIMTKLVACTNTLPFRIVAWESSGKRVTVSAEQGDKAYSDVATHVVAADKLAKLMGWEGDVVSGVTKEGFVFVFLSCGQYHAGSAGYAFKIGGAS
jgi:hypothetical protein